MREPAIQILEARVCWVASAPGRFPREGFAAGLRQTPAAHSPAGVRNGVLVGDRRPLSTRSPPVEPRPLVMSLGN